MNLNSRKRILILEAGLEKGRKRIVIFTFPGVTEEKKIKRKLSQKAKLIGTFQTLLIIEQTQTEIQ